MRPSRWSPVMHSSLIFDVELTASNQWDRKSMREVEVIRLSRDALFPTTLPLTTRTVVHSRPSSPVVAESLKLIFVTEGWGQLRTASGLIDLVAGSIVVLPAGAWCAAEPVIPLEMVTLYLHPLFAQSQVGWMPSVHPLTHHLKRATSMGENAGTLHLGGGAMATLRRRLVTLSEHRLKVVDDFAMYADLASLFSDIGRMAGNGSSASSSPDRSRRTVRLEVARAVWVLRQDPAKPWSVRALASEVSLSESQLTRLFREELGIGPAAFLWNVRIDRMAEHLVENHLSVAEASRETGWSSRSAASRAFKRRYGISPVEFARERAERLLIPE